MIGKILLALGLTMCLAQAQQQKIKTALVTYALGGPPGGFKAFFRNGEEIKPFAANSSGLGEPFRYEGPRRFEIRESMEAFEAPPAGQQAKPPLAFVDLPENSNNILVLAADAGQGKIRLLAYDVSSANLRAGDYRIFNFSNSTVEINIGKQKLVLARAQNEMMKDAAWQDPKPQALPLLIRKFSGKAMVPVKQSPWEHWPTKRTVMFLFDGAHKGEPLGIMSFNVEPPPREQAGAAASQ